MADSKPEERRELGTTKIARITTKTSILLTLYFCNVVVVSRATNSPESLHGSKGRKRKRHTQARLLPTRTAMISASLPRIRRHRCTQSHAPGSCEGALRVGCLSLHLANACW